MPRVHKYAPMTLDAVRILGLEVARLRRQRRMTAAELAERVGVSHVTLRKIERGDPGVAIGTVFEAARLVGVPLFGADSSAWADMASRQADRLAVVPERVRRRRADEVDDDF
jgi:transcriptional regulator with XRE-family HTH domain